MTVTVGGTGSSKGPGGSLSSALLKCGELAGQNVLTELTISRRWPSDTVPICHLSRQRHYFYIAIPVLSRISI